MEKHAYIQSTHEVPVVLPEQHRSLWMRLHVVSEMGGGGELWFRSWVGEGRITVDSMAMCPWMSSV